MAFVYALKSEVSGRYYIGSTVDVRRRLAQHNSGMTIATRHLRPWTLVYSEQLRTVADARKRERQLKSWKNRPYMQRMVGVP